MSLADAGLTHEDAMNVTFGESKESRSYHRDREYEGNGYRHPLLELGPVATAFVLFAAAVYWVFHKLFGGLFPCLLVCCLVASAPREASAEEEIVGVYVDNDLAAYTIGEHYPTSFNLVYEFQTIDDIQYGSDGVWTDQTHFESCFKALDFTVTGYWIVSATASFELYAKKNGVWGMYDVEVDIFGVKNVWQGGDEIDLSIDYTMTPQ